MSRPTRSWFRLAVPAMLVIASIVGGLGPVPGASGQAAATTTPTAIVATTPAMAVASGTATVVVGVPTSVATVVATPETVATGSMVSGTATVTVTGTRVAGTVTPAVPAVATASAGVPPAGATGPPGMLGEPWGGMVPLMPGRGSAVGGVIPMPKVVVAAGTGAIRTRNTVTGMFMTLVAGTSHTCGLTSGGEAYCWGDNGFGQLGEGTSGNIRTSPMEVTGGRRFTTLVAGGNRTCALDAGGTAYCWGENQGGMLGDGTTEMVRTSPVQVANGRQFMSLAAGGYHTCGLVSGGTAYCWGYNASGQLGDGTVVTETAPVEVSDGLTFTALAAGSDHTCGLASGGKAYCWGKNGSGQLGDGTSGVNQDDVSVNRTYPVAVSGGVTFTSLVAGYSHTCALAAGGEPYCWGSNGTGQLGDGTSGVNQEGVSANRNSPVAVSGGRTFTSLVAGYSHTCGLAPAGAAYCWGSNGEGQLGDGTNATANRSAPVAVSGGWTFTTLVAGWGHTCGLAPGGTAYCWGTNWAGQLGDGNPRWQTVEVNGGRTFTSLVAGSSHTCGLAPGGAAYCWGSNGEGQLGDGTSGNIRTSPVEVTGGQTFTSLVAGSFHTCGLALGGAAYCWGRNQYGQLGDGTTDRKPPYGKTTPIAVSGGRTFASLTADYGHTCGVDPGGAAYCWGWNYFGQLGDGSTTHRLTPVAVSGRLTFASLAAS